MFYYKNKTLIIVYFFIVISLFLFSCNSSPKEKQIAEKGVIDLSSWNFESQGIVNLDGDWEFYWNELKNPDDFDSTYNKTDGFIKVPLLWNKYIYENKPIGSYGFATYRLKILLPEKEKIYSLKFNRIETSYKLWIDNKLISEIGKVGQSKKTMTSAWIPKEYDFYTDTNFVYLTIQVSNFNHRKGGIAKHIKIGTPEQIAKHTRVIVGFEIFVLGAILILALYYLGLYVLRREDKSTLFFFLASLLTGVYTTVNGEFISSRLIPDFNWYLLVKINFLSNYGRIALFSLFLGYLFKKEISPIFVKIISATVGFMMLVVIFTPATLYSRTLIVLILIALITLVYLSIGLIRASLNKRPGAILSLIGTLLVVLASINDVLLDNGMINSIYLISFGLFVLIFFQSLMLSVRSAYSFNETEKLTTRLVKLDKIQNELLSIPSNDLGSTLQILQNNFSSNRALLFVSVNNQLKVFSETLNDKIIVHELDVDEAENLISYDLEVINKCKNEDIDYISSEITKYQIENKVDSVMSSPIFENHIIKAILYFEKNGKTTFDERTIEVIKLLKSQLANIIDNAFVYSKLEDLNKNLENKVEQRTAELNRQKLEIEQKNVELDEIVEELKVTTDVVESVNIEMKEKNEILEKQKIEILEKHEEMLQQREEILTINEVLEKRQEEILNKNTELEIQKYDILKKNQQITDSIEYARRIQMALLKSEKNIPFAENFILYKPRNIVSGDFYWIKKFFNYIVIVAADCTGHGVPGAFMSMLGISFLSEVANKHFRKISKIRLSASLILEDLRESVIKALSNKNEKLQSKDGMDISLCIIDKDNNLMQFAAAYNPAYVIRENKIIELEADKMPIGIYQKETKPFFNQEFQLLENDRLYLFSDGYVDQFGGPNGRKFLKNRFKDLLIEINQLPMNEQHEKLENTYIEWKKDQKQTDDILVMGFLI